MNPESGVRTRDTANVITLNVSLRRILLNAMWAEACIDLSSAVTAEQMTKIY